jgi:hypothetical protein
VPMLCKYLLKVHVHPVFVRDIQRQLRESLHLRETTVEMVTRCCPAPPVAQLRVQCAFQSAFSSDVTLICSHSPNPPRKGLKEKQKQKGCGAEGEVRVWDVVSRQ